MCPSPWKIELQQHVSCFLFVWHREGTVGSQKHCFNLFIWRLSPALLPAWNTLILNSKNTRFLSHESLYSAEIDKYTGEAWHGIMPHSGSV